MIAEGVQGAVTGSEDVWVTHMLYAVDLTLLANAQGALLTMFNRLAVSVHSKHLAINIAKSEAVLFNSRRGAKVPILKVARDALKCSNSSRYIGVTFHQTLT